MGPGGTREWERIAWTAAAAVQARASAQAAGTDPVRAGRNEPCPCGSGRKFKKCCLSKRLEDVVQPVPAGHVVNSPRRELIPSVTDQRSVDRDMGVLSRLFRSAPRLKDVRFPPACMDLVLAQLPPEAPEADEEKAEEIDDLAFRFANQTGYSLPMDLDQRLLETAPEAADTSELRALALGLIFAGALKVPAADQRNPLVPLVFRVSLQEHLEADRVLDRVIDDLQIRGMSREELYRRKDELGEGITRRMEQLGHAARHRLLEQGDRRMEHVESLLKDGRFPVHLPFVTLLPILLRLTLRKGWRGKVAANAGIEAIEEGRSEWISEDASLFGDCLDQWLAKDDRSRPDVTSAVRLVRETIRLGGLAAFGWQLALGSLHHMPSLTFSGEEDCLDGLGKAEDGFSARFLERYGDLVHASGFPALARRTWALCRLLGAMPEEVARKLGEKESARPEAHQLELDL